MKFAPCYTHLKQMTVNKLNNHHIGIFRTMKAPSSIGQLCDSFFCTVYRQYLLYLLVLRT